MVGQTLAHYGIGDCLGEGGSGVVYRGRDLRLERPVAIKVLADALRDDELAWGRLLREARLASQLNHPHIAAIHDLGEEDGCAFIVMEYVEGIPLGDLILDGGMPIEQVARYTEQIAGALAFAHRHGVIHGDLKGSNIMVTSLGDIKLLDFGLGRRIPRDGMAEVTSSCLPLAQAGATAGTLPFLAPEVLRGNPASRQSDVWALGVLIYQMATGELPFRGATPFELSVEIMVSEPAKLHKLPEPLQSTVRGCLEKDPLLRKAQAAEVGNALVGNAVQTDSTAPVGECATAADSVAPAALPAPRHHTHWWVAGATAALSMLLLGGMYAWRAQSPQPVAKPVAVAPQVLKAFGAGNSAVKVWVNTDSGAYHCPGTRWYGKTHAGEYMTQKQAQEKGYHPSANRACW